MLPKVEWNGRMIFRLSNLLTLLNASLTTTVRRRLHGPRQPNWGSDVETVITFLKKQTQTVSRMTDVQAGRDYYDAVLFCTPELERCQVEAVAGPVKGDWFTCENMASRRTVLYLHGGGYVHYTKSIRSLIALAAISTRGRTFALDYRLAPKHPFPAALDDALAAYQWLLTDQGVSPTELVVMGDSAGGHLTLSLLQALSARQIPLPALGILFCPWVDVQNRGESMQRNSQVDWIDKRILDQWGQCFYQGHDPNDGRITPALASLAGLPPLYIQCGQAEVLYDMICGFMEQARAQQADVRLDTWPGMVHDFQIFGAAAPESSEAWERVQQVVDGCLGSMSD